MERPNTRQEILDTALGLFAQNGYEATSISQIADAVGIRKASLYSHFASKREILDELVRQGLDEYNERSIFARADRDFPTDITPDSLTRMILGHINFILHDPRVSRSRRMLTLEQFRNPELGRLFTKQNYTDVILFFTRLIEKLTRDGRLTDSDPEIMAAQLCLPISAWIALCDREPERESEIMALIERHIRQFFKIYGRS